MSLPLYFDLLVADFEKPKPKGAPVRSKEQQEKKELPPPSEEQSAVLQAIAEGKNVIVDSVAGSGKTTTSLLLGTAQSTKKIQLITYNARLKQETRDRVVAAGITNIEVHSYHSFGLKYYKDPCFTDLDLKTILRTNQKPKRPIEADIFIFDEAQDLTPIYFRFLRKILADCSSKQPESGARGRIGSPGRGETEPQLLVLGDHLQCIYDFPQKGADHRYLSLADSIFPAGHRSWERLYLRISYRITKPMEWFVNNVMLGYPRMVALKESSEPVRYITGNPFAVLPTWFFQEISTLLETYSPDDIFILAPSVKSNNDVNPIKKLENLLVKNGIPCFCPTNDDEELKDEVLAGKVVFSSFHQSKGLERKIVIIASFSSSYYFTAKDDTKDVCPKALYVAATRAQERLYFWAEDGGDMKPLPFLKHHLLESGSRNLKKITLRPSKKTGKTEAERNEESKYLLRRVTDLTRFIPEEVLHTALELLCLKTIKAPQYDYDIPLIIDTEDGKKESVADLNGIAIPTIFEHRLTGKISIQEDLETHYLAKLQSENSVSENRIAWVQAIKEVPQKPRDYLLLSNLYQSYISGYLFKLVQIQDYGWLTKRMVEQLVGVVAENIKEESEFLQFEYTLERDDYPWSDKTLLIAGRADVVDDEAVWELKCVDQIKSESFIQLALYAWLWENTERAEHGKRAFRILNIRTGEIIEITGIVNLDAVLELVLDNHFRMANKKTDEEFILEAAKEEVAVATSAGKVAQGGAFMFCAEESDSD